MCGDGRLRRGMAPVGSAATSTESEPVTTAKNQYDNQCRSCLSALVKFTEMHMVAVPRI